MLVRLLLNQAAGVRDALGLCAALNGDQLRRQPQRSIGANGKLIAMLSPKYIPIGSLLISLLYPLCKHLMDLGGGFQRILRAMP